MDASILLGLVVFVQMLLCSKSSGQFELRLVAYHNQKGQDEAGLCCGGLDDSHCSDSCATFFRVCLKQYQNSIDPEPPCTYGSRVTDVLGANSVDFARHPEFQEPMRFPFSFAWPGTFSLIVEAWHNSSSPNDAAAAKQLLLRLAEGKVTRVSTDWTSEDHRIAASHLQLQYRVVCDPDYYGPQCVTYCRPRDEDYGHYTCSSSGSKQCLPGWQGPNCDKAVCRPGCHPDNGFCEQPGECRCKLGFLGDLCNQCQRYPGCKHGSCQKPFECSCQEGWGGLFCNQDLNFCTHHKPCLNQATCTNTGAGHYTCTCQPGFTGTNCEIKIEDCSQDPCLNGGTCRELVSNYTCECREGFRGRHCQISAQTCEEEPCQNGASCLHTGDGYACVCAPGWAGDNCDIEKDECHSLPCLNGGRCVDEFDGYKCVCPIGFDSANCEVNINDCSESTCLNGGTCMDDVNYFKCECPPGFSGTLCQYNIDDCVKRPCANGGTCFDLLDDYRCMCRPGFRGKDCSIDVNECASHPCRNGASCQDHIDDYTCHCAPCYTGKNCDIRHDDCLWDVTFRPDTRPGKTSPKPPTASSQRNLEQTLMAVVVPVIVAFSLVVAILLLVLFCLWRRYKRDGNGDQETRQNLRNARLAATDRVNNQFAVSSLYGDIQKPKVENDQRYACTKATNLDSVYSVDRDPMPETHRHPNTFSARAVPKAISVERLSFKQRTPPLALESPKSPSQPLFLKTERSKDSGLGSPVEATELSPSRFRRRSRTYSGDSGLVSPVTLSPQHSQTGSFRPQQLHSHPPPRRSKTPSLATQV